MEQKLNIAEILRNKPHGIKLYSPIFGDCTFCYIKDETNDICVRRPYNEISYFSFNGVYHTGGDIRLADAKLLNGIIYLTYYQRKETSNDCIGIYCSYVSCFYNGNLCNYNK